MLEPHIRQCILEFRIAELKAVLNVLSLPISGRKQELQARVFHYLGESFQGVPPSQFEPVKEEWRVQAAKKTIVDVYNNWMGSRTPGSVSRVVMPQSVPMAQSPPAQNGTALNGIHPNPAAGADQAQPSGLRSPSHAVETITAGENIAAGSAVTPKKLPVNGRLAAVSPLRSPRSAGGVIRCVCDNNIDRGFMVQCEGGGCGVWQHCSCVGIEGEAPEHYFCEQCRACWADPFWEVRNARVMPISRLVPSGGPTIRGSGGMTEIEQVAERTFSLTHSQIALLKDNADFQLQAVCLLLNDPVPFRFQWPRHAEMKVNQMSYRVYTRQPSSKVGNNTRDEPADLAKMTFAGQNRIRLKVNDSRKLVLMAQMVKRRDVAGVKTLMAPPESIETALQRVRQQVGSADDELSVGSTIVSLRDPLSGARVVAPARFQGLNGLVPFDLETFLGMVQRTRKWQCPHSMRHTRVQELQIDTYVTYILQSLKDLPDIVEIEVSPEGQWRPSTGRYAWTNIQDQLLPPLPEPIAVKPEPGLMNGSTVEDDSDEEELSEAEELRRAAAAYAKVAKRPAPDIIVLDDSSDEDSAIRKRARMLLNQQAAQAPAAAANIYRQKPMHQQTLQSSLRQHRAANGVTNSSAPVENRQSTANPIAASSGRLFDMGGARDLASNGPPTNLAPLNIRLPQRSSGVSAAGPVQSTSQLNLPQPSLAYTHSMGPPRDGMIPTSHGVSSHINGNGQTNVPNAYQHASYNIASNVGSPHASGAAPWKPGGDNSPRGGLSTLVSSYNPSASLPLSTSNSSWSPPSGSLSIPVMAPQSPPYRSWHATRVPPQASSPASPQAQRSAPYTSGSMLGNSGSSAGLGNAQLHPGLAAIDARHNSYHSPLPPVPPPPPPDNGLAAAAALQFQDLNASSQALLNSLADPGRGHYSSLLHSPERQSQRPLSASIHPSPSVIDLDSD